MSHVFKVRCYQFRFLADFLGYEPHKAAFLCLISVFGQYLGKPFDKCCVNGSYSPNFASQNDGCNALQAPFVFIEKIIVLIINLFLIKIEEVD
jgi:hypothetical protein